MRTLACLRLVVPVVVSACAATPFPEEAPEQAQEIDEYIASLGWLPSDPARVVEGARGASQRQGDFSCSTQRLAETRQYDRIVAYSANSESLWPGALVAGDSVYSGLFSQLVFDRAPVAFSVSLENLGGPKSATVTEPTLSRYRDALTHLLEAEITGATPANISAEIESVHSREQLTLALGLDVSWLGGGGVSSSFDFNDEQVRSRFLVKYTQAYYTVDLDQPQSASALLGPSVTLEEVQGKIPEGQPPLYVSSITYGRTVLFTFESEYSAHELGAALDFVYRGGVDVSGDVSVTYEDIVSSSKISAYILGGSGAEAARSIDGYEALMAFIQSGGDYSKDSPGAPIAYKLSHMTDNSPARLSFTRDYELTECERVSQRVLVVLESIRVTSDGGDLGNDLEIYGEIWASAGQRVALFDRDDEHYVSIRDGEIWPPAGGIAETVLEVVPAPGQAIEFGADLEDSDGLLPDDSVGSEITAAAFETGWRRDVVLQLSGDDARIEVTFHIEPI